MGGCIKTSIWLSWRVYFLPYMNNVPGIVNTDHSKLCRITTRSLGKVGAMLRENTTNSSTAKACLVTYLSSRQTRVKQSNDMKGLRRSQLLHDGLRWFVRFRMLVFITYIVGLNSTYINLLI
jgi:hypothetical protein